MGGWVFEEGIRHKMTLLHPHQVDYINEKRPNLSLESTRVGRLPLAVEL